MIHLVSFVIIALGEHILGGKYTFGWYGLIWLYYKMILYIIKKWLLIVKWDYG